MASLFKRGAAVGNLPGPGVNIMPLDVQLHLEDAQLLPGKPTCIMGLLELLLYSSYDVTLPGMAR